MGGYGQVLGSGGAEQVGLYVWEQALAGWASQPAKAAAPKPSLPASPMALINQG